MLKTELYFTAAELSKVYSLFWELHRLGLDPIMKTQNIFIYKRAL